MRRGVGERVTRTMSLKKRKGVCVVRPQRESQKMDGKRDLSYEPTERGNKVSPKNFTIEEFL